MYFDADAATFATNISRLEKFNRLVVELDHSMRKILLQNNQLDEFVIESCRDLISTLSYETIEREYSECLMSKIDGVQWNVKRIENRFTFSKSVQN